MTAADAPALASLWSDSETTRWLGGPRDEAWVRADIEADVAAGDQPAGNALWTLADPTTDRVAGHCGLLRKVVDGEPMLEVTYVVHRDYRGRGWASEVAQWLVTWARDEAAAPFVIALIVPGNEASRRVAAKAGLSLWKTTVRDDGSVREVWRTELFHQG